MIKTRPTLNDIIHGDGDHLLALDIHEIKLIAAILGVTRLGHGGYSDVAHNLSMTLEEATDNAEICMDALEEIQPKFNVHDPITYDVTEIYDHDDISIAV